MDACGYFSKNGYCLAMGNWCDKVSSNDCPAAKELLELKQ